MRLKDLIGKYVFISADKFYKWGRIIDLMETKYIMIKMLSGAKEAQTGTFLYCLEDILQKDEAYDGLFGWRIFNTKRELDKYVDWIEESNSDEKPKILKLVKKDDEKENNLV
jgi:hypothetical protein